MATEVISIIDPDNGPGTDYTSLAAWEAGEQGDLIGARDEIAVAECRSTGGTADTTAVTVDGWTTSDTQYIVIRAAAADQAVKTGLDLTRYRLAGAAHNSIFANHVRIEGLQVVVDGDYTGLQIYNQSAGADIRISRCRITGQSSGTGQQRGLYVGSADATVRLNNTIIANMAATGAGRGIQVNAAASLDVHNCIVYGCTSAGVVEYSVPDPGISVINTALFNNGTDAGGTLTVDHCASDSNVGTNHVAESSSDTHWTADFADAASGDFTLLAGSNLVGAGVTDPGGGLYNDDIDGAVRSGAWDVGVDQYTSGATDYTLGADPGAHAAGGQDAALLHARRLTAESAAHELTGTDTALLKSSRLAAEPGGCNISGTDAVLLQTHLLTADPGGCAVTGTDAALVKNSLLAADADNYTVTGADAALTHISGITLTAEPGSMALAGTDAALTSDRRLIADSGAVATTGQDADLGLNRVLAVEPGGVALTGADAALLRNAVLNADPGTVTSAGQDTALNYSGFILPSGRASIAFTTKQPTITFS